MNVKEFIYLNLYKPVIYRKPLEATQYELVKWTLKAHGAKPKLGP